MLLHPVTPQLATPTNPGHFQHFELIIPMALLLHLQEASPGHGQFGQTPITLGQIPISSYQSPIGALGHPSPFQHSGLVPALNGHLGRHPIHDGAKLTISPHQTSTLFLLLVIVSWWLFPSNLVLIIVVHPLILHLTSLLPQLLALVYK